MRFQKICIDVLSKDHINYKHHLCTILSLCTDIKIFQKFLFTRVPFSLRAPSFSGLQVFDQGPPHPLRVIECHPRTLNIIRVRRKKVIRASRKNFRIFVGRS